MRQKKKLDKSVYRSFAMISQFGINMLVPIGLMTWLGVYLDSKFGTSYLVILLFFIGALAGGRNVYRQAKSIFGNPSDSTDRVGKLRDNDREIKRD